MRLLILLMLVTMAQATANISPTEDFSDMDESRYALTGAPMVFPNTMPVAAETISGVVRALLGEEDAWRQGVAEFLNNSSNSTGGGLGDIGHGREDLY